MFRSLLGLVDDGDDSHSSCLWLTWIEQPNPVRTSITKGYKIRHSSQAYALFLSLLTLSWRQHTVMAPVLDDADHKVLVQLRSSSLDQRTDAEIADLLRIYHPVTSEKNVWAFWDSSYDAMHPWCRRNVLGWVRRLGPSWTVRVLDTVPGSPNHFHNFVGPEHFPTAFYQGKLTGRNKGQHVSDLVRLAVLYQVRKSSRVPQQFLMQELIAILVLRSNLRSILQFAVGFSPLWSCCAVIIIICSSNFPLIHHCEMLSTLYS